MDESAIQRHSGGWLFYVKAAFGISLGLMVLGIVWLPTDLWIKGYLVMGIMFVVGSTITLAKTLREYIELGYNSHVEDLAPDLISIILGSRDFQKQ